MPTDNQTASNGVWRSDAGPGAVANGDSDPAGKPIHDYRCLPVKSEKRHSGPTNHVPRRTQLEATRLFIEEFGDELRYCAAQRRWLFWDGVRWIHDQDGHVIRLATRASSLIAREALQAPDEDSRANFYRWAARAESQCYIKAIVELAKTAPNVPVSVTELDRDPMLLCVQNGAIDLRTGRWTQSQKGQLITKQAPVRYDPTAKCPRWQQFIDEITGGDVELCAYLQRCAGYWLTGLTREQCFFILYGDGSNGKSVFIRTLQTLMGDYAVSTPPETLMEKRSSGAASPDLARLRGSRLAVASESSSTSVLAEPLVKQLTGQDKVVCRDLYSGFFEYQPAFKLVLSTNHRPDIQGTDHAIWRRIHLIPFRMTVREDRQDKQLGEKLEAEFPGILNWVIVGALDYQENGLKRPRCVLDATAAYRSDMDVLGDWLKEECEDIPSATTPVKNLHDAYFSWCIREGHSPIGKGKFGDELEKRGYRRDRKGGARVHIGIKLKAAATEHTQANGIAAIGSTET